MTASAWERLDDLMLSERCAQDRVADAISLGLYQRHYDELPASVRTRVEGAALHALRGPQAVWAAEAFRRAHRNLELAMRDEMGVTLRMMAPAQRQELARIGVQAVVAALIGVLEVQDPFIGSGEALKVYEAAEAATKEVK